MRDEERAAAKQREDALKAKITEVLKEAERRAEEAERRATLAEKRAAAAAAARATAATAVPLPSSGAATGNASSSSSAAAAAANPPHKAAATPPATAAAPAPPPSAPAARPAPPPPSPGGRVVHSFKIGARVLAVAPAGSDDEEADDGGGAGGGDGAAERWVPGRVLAERSHGGTKQFKISLDGYDSEDDAWVDADDDRVRPYEAGASLAGGGGAGGAGNGVDDKVSARLAQEERDRARRFNEQRKEEARSAFRAAAGS